LPQLIEPYGTDNGIFWFFRRLLAKLGWIKGTNLRIELRWSAADAERIKTFAKELVDLRPDAIFSQTTPAIGALARETQAVPIIFVLVSDPIGSGFAASLAHPSKNITGFTGNDPAIGGKWMELLKEIAASSRALNRGSCRSSSRPNTSW
jgi:putative tryptophan/tyrosine transport system substrate-binding protein